MRLSVRSVRLELLLIAITLVMTFGVSTNVGAEGELTTVEPPVDTTTTEATEVQPIYTYNPETGLWDSNLWYFDPILGTYQPTSQPVVDTTTTESDPLLTQGESQLESDNSVQTDVDNNINVDNTIQSDATSGDATVADNNTAGSASSGTAESVATVLNEINSVVGLGGGSVASFETNVIGDVSGDIVLQPMILQTLLGSEPNSCSAEVNNINSLTNNINLNATSGDAAVLRNTVAGDATTGAATTVANVINVINSMIASGQSFIGTINIYGSLTGNILIAPDFLPQLLADNYGESDQMSLQKVTIKAEDMLSIVNNISINADSGDAVVADNTKAGSATTGDATTNLVIFNLTGHEIIAGNSLLVFVNVLGEWVGVIVDAPTGATAALFGNNVSTNNNLPSELVLVTETDNQIVNNISLSSTTGDAFVKENTLAGNAISGDATASVNLMNIVGNRFSLSGWFGVLFINVFGRWFGNFGTAEVDQPDDGDNSGPVINVDEAPTVIEFIPASQAETGSYWSSNVVLANTISEVVKSDIVEKDVNNFEGVVLASTDQNSSLGDLILAIAIGLSIGFLLYLVFTILKQRTQLER